MIRFLKYLSKFQKLSFLLLFGGSFCLLNSLSAQDLAFSQFYHTPFLTNPAGIGFAIAERVGERENIEYFKSSQLFMNYRFQPTESGNNFSTPILSWVNPMYNRDSKKLWGGFGLSILNDNQSGFLNTTGGVLAFAYHLPLGKDYLSWGLQGGYFQRNYDIDAIIVDNQIITGIFDPNASINEDFMNLNQGYGIFSAGFMWHHFDRGGDQKFYLGLNVNNINRPDISLLQDGDNHLPRNLTATGGITFFENRNVQLTPNFRWINRLDFNYVHVGTWLEFELFSRRRLSRDGLMKMGAWYNSNQAVAVAFSLDQPKYFATLSYDIPTGAETSNWLGNGAIELTLGLKFRKKIKDKPLPQDTISDLVDTLALLPDTLVADTLDLLIAENDTLTQDSLQVDTLDQQLPEERLAVRDRTNQQDSSLVVNPNQIPSVDTITVGGDVVEFSPKVVAFRLGRQGLSVASEKTLEELAELLLLYSGTQIEVVGYTCDLGSYQDNLKLSLERAAVVRDFLAQRGVDPARVRLVGKGEEDPIASNQTVEGRELNRRVEINPILQ